jgi:adenosylmethionine-8-amino-7-oxononanoate aminotransferase
VALSNVFCLLKLGAKVRVCGPPTLIPKHYGALGVEVSYDVRDTLLWCDVANVLRIQLERQDIKYFPSLREYHRLYGITEARLADIRGRGLFRGVELVAERAGKVTFDPALKLHAKLKAAAMVEGMLCYPMGGAADGTRGDHVLLAPPFIVSEAQLDEIVEKLARAVKVVTGV